MEIIEHFQLQNTDLDIDKVDDEEFKKEEEFFALMAGAINRLG